MRSKYRNRKTRLDGQIFASAKEARRYQELILLERAGEIHELETQVPFVLQEGFRKGGRCYRPIVYVADFVYQRAGKTVVEDAKGYRTDVYRLKKSCSSADTLR